MVFLDFQFMRIVFLAIVRATRSNLLSVSFELIMDMSPNIQREGDNGMCQMPILHAYDMPILPINFSGEQMRTNTTQHLQRQWRHQQGSVHPLHLMRVHLQTGKGINLFLFNEILIISVFLRCTACAKMEAYAFRLVSGTVPNSC